MIKRLFICGVIVILALCGCANNRIDNSDNGELEMENANRQENSIFFDERAKLIIEKTDNSKSCEDIEREFDYNKILGYLIYVSTSQYLGYADPNCVECVRMADSKKYLYIIYKVIYDDKYYWAYSFYKLYDNGKYCTDSVLLVNGDENIYKIKQNYTLDDLLDIDKEFIKSIDG